MARLTMTKVALGGVRRAKGRYKTMILGAGLAIFFVTALFLAVQSIFETYRLSHVARVGSQDGIIRDAEAMTPEMLLDTGLVTRVGSAYVIAQTQFTQCPIGYYDQVGAQMAGRVAIQGRLPQGPGEIALEPGVLQKLRSDAQVGGDISLTLEIPMGKDKRFLPGALDKTYRLVGILKPQSEFLEGNTLSDWEYLHMPSALVWDGERVALGGRAIVHRMVDLRRGVSPREFETYFQQTLGLSGALSTQFGLFGGMYSNDQGPGQIMVAVAVLLGVLLTLAACQGIVNAFTLSLNQRRAQIGMMRAVGATSRQIRAIFGREALILAACVSPLAIALAYLFVWALCRATGLVTFSQSPWFLPLDIALSLLCVMLAAWVPLVGASKLAPMQAIRDVSLLRARGRVRVKMRRAFDAPRLIARRHLALYRTRQAGIAAMVCLSVVMISAAVPFATGIWSTPSPYGYLINGFRYISDAFVEENVNAQSGLTDGDIQEILGLPGVAGVDAAAQAQVNLVVDRVAPYQAKLQPRDYWTDDPGYYRAFRAQRGLQRQVVPAGVFAFDEGAVAALAPYVLEGQIDIAALNRGEQVLVIAPKEYYRYPVTYSDGYVAMVADPAPPKDGERYEVMQNDAYRAGDPLDLLRLYARGTMNLPQDGWDFVTGIEEERARATIGAVLDADASWAAAGAGYWSVGLGNLITTHRGLAAMGITAAGYFSAGVRIQGQLTQAAGAYLSDQLLAIAARGRDMRFVDNVAGEREQALWQGVVKASLGAVLALLLSMCVGLVNSAIAGRVLSDKRAIGTLRAVGAPVSAIVSSYRLQAAAMIARGAVAGTLLSALYYLWYLRAGTVNLPVRLGLVALCQAAFLGAVALMCGANLRLKVGRVTRASIVSNIREL